MLLLAANQTAVSLVNWVAMLIAKPKILPRLDFDDGIPLECRTLVVVPTVISTPDDVDRLLEMLEVRYLGNRDGRLPFALLSDLPAADSEVLPQDAETIARAVAGTEEAELTVCGRGAAAVPAPAPAPAVEPARGPVHGLRAEARRDRGPERAAARGADRALRRDRRRPRGPRGHAVRRSHSTPTPSCPATRPASLSERPRTRSTGP